MRNPGALGRKQSRGEQGSREHKNGSGQPEDQCQWSPNFPRVGSVPVKLYCSRAPIHLIVSDHAVFHQQDKLGMRK